MANAFSCDRCKVIYAATKSQIDAGVRIQFRYQTGEDKPGVIVDLCPNCKQSFFAFLATK